MGYLNFILATVFFLKQAITVTKPAWTDHFPLLTCCVSVVSGVTGAYNTTLDDAFAKELRRAYYACVTYIDDLFGEALGLLDDYGLADDTVVVFTSDHGWQLGEHAEWAKQTNFELAVRTPVMIKVPGE